MDKYVVYINSDATTNEFPYTLNGFLKALHAAKDTKKEFRLDVVHVVNPNRVDLDNANGLTKEEEAVAIDYWEFYDYI